MTQRRFPYRRAGVLAAILMLALLVPTASGATRSDTINVSCDGTTVATGVRVFHSPSGTFKIKQNDSNPNSTTQAYARSDNGNDLPKKNVADGQTAIWTNVIANYYTVRADRSGSSNCNGAWPGHGNYSWDYTVTYQ